MFQQSFATSGVQYVPQIAVQYVYLDFDGELTDYNGEILTIEGVEVRDSKLTQARVADILAELNKKYASQNVIFVTERPANAEYSTIFIGKTEAFDQYGNFAGLAETVDFNNQNHSDNAFVNLDSTATDEQIISTISHETDHLLGTLSHGGDGLQAYAETYNIKLDETLNGIELHYGDFMYISSGGTANDTALNYGDMYISSGGTANNTTIDDDGDMYISSGGTANDTTLNYGYMYISSGGTANTTINDGGDMCISSGGTANNTTLNYGWMYISSGGTANNTIINDGWMYISSGGTANNTTINDGSMRISSGGTANNTIINTAFDIDIDSGVTMNNTIINTALNMDIDSGVTMNNTTVNAGYIRISSGAAVHNTTVNDGATAYIESGVKTSGTVVNSGGELHISGGTMLDKTTINSGGSVYINFNYPENVRLDNTTVNGTMGIFSGIIANNTVINSGGSIHVSRGAFANNTTINSDGTICIDYGSFVNNFTFNSGGSMVLSSFFNSTARVDNVTVNGGSVVIENRNYDSEINNVTITSWGAMSVSDRVTVNRNTVDFGGTMYISYRGIANGNTINFGGTMYISRGSASNTTVNYGGSLNITNDGKHYGSLQIESGAIVSATGGATVYFPLSGRNAAGGYLINNLSAISGYPNFKITVSTDQDAGTYRLAQGAENFNKTINIETDTNVHIGSLSVNDSAYEFGSNSYRLVKTDGNLDLVVENMLAAKADLSISSLNVSKNNINTKESIKLTFKVVNNGEQFAPESMIKVYDGDTLIREIALQEIDTGANRNCYITVTSGKLSVGTHKIYVVVDANNAISESNEDNNRAYRTVNVENKADLRISSFEVSKNNINTKESTKLTFQVFNDGDKLAPESMIKVYDGDKLLREIALGEIDAGAYRNCTITIPAGKLTEGSHKIYVAVDANGAIPEANEDNNRAYRTINVVKKADLRVPSFEMTSNSITSGESTKLTFQVFNDGDKLAPESMIKVYDGDTLLREISLGEIAAGGYRNCTITLTSGKLSVGTHKIYVLVDANGAVTESNEDNNRAYRTLFVKEPVRSLATAPKENNSWDVCGTGSVDALCGENYADLGEWSLENSAALTRSAADILTTGNEESRLLNSGKLAG